MSVKTFQCHWCDLYESVTEENNWLICYLCHKIRYFHAGFLPCFLAPVNKRHHTTTTEQQNFGTPAQQPSEEEYFYPTIIKHISLGFCGFLIQQHEDTYTVNARISARGAYLIF